MIHQHFKLVDVFTAAQNIVLGLEGKGAFDLRAAARRVKEISEKYGFDIDPAKKVYDMSVSEKQTVEILKVLYRGRTSSFWMSPPPSSPPRRPKSSSPSCATCALTARPSSSSPTSSTRSWPSPTGWPSSARASTSAPSTPPTPIHRSSPR